MRASAALLLLTLAALTLDARAATCSYVCDASQTPATTCHATCDVTFTFCAMGQTCPYSFDLAGSDAQTGARFEVGTDAGSVRGGTVGGDPSCTAAGCDRQKLSLTFQSASLNATWDAGAGCGGDGHAPQVSLRRVPRPEIAPADPSHREGHVREHPLALHQRQSLGDGGLLRQSRLAFTASSPARVEPPPNPRASPTPPAPPPAPGAFAPGGSGRTRARRRPPRTLGVPRRLRRPRIRLHAHLRAGRRAGELAVGSKVGALPMRRGAGGGRRARNTGRVRVIVVLVRAGVLEVQRTRGDGRVLGLSPGG